jgi:ABC-type multidrug transport system fused ATPase/permease subunit
MFHQLSNPTQVKIRAALESLMERRTVIMLTKRLSMIQSADKILVLENGTIVEAVI